MKKLGAVIAVLVLAALAAIGLASCGGGSDAPPAAAGGKKGGTLNGTYASFPDYMDPALSYTAEGWTAMADVYVPLLTYKHANGEEGSEVIPGLAKELPKISNGGKTYTLFLRPGLKYSDGTPVKASDFPFAVERMIELNSGGSPFYLTIEGAEKFAETKQGADPRDQDQRQDRRNRHQPRRPARHLHQRARPDVRRAAAAGHADRRPLGQPAPRHRPLHDHQIAAGQGLGIRAQPVLGESQRQGDAGPARRHRRQRQDRR